MGQFISIHTQCGLEYFHYVASHLYGFLAITVDLIYLYMALLMTVAIERSSPTCLLPPHYHLSLLCVVVCMLYM